jgi:hypothetical protein
VTHATIHLLRIRRPRARLLIRDLKIDVEIPRIADVVVEFTATQASH